ncbi:MAG: LysR family transcriptional regulator [Rhodospirillales bacterium 20-60-12]|nr:MAG: LysR family transcriptional regulator [Rhodospirillales bacterium 20-60-12]HQT66131.1 LysR family transcriptional regulator [Acetobacteraceae bacterium]
MNTEIKPRTKNLRRRNFTLRQLTLFEAVARTGSFTRTAEELHLTQPAVSNQIKQLEDQIGTPLFEHIGRRISPTEVGRELVVFCRDISQRIDEFENLLDDIKGLHHGVLNVSVVSTAEYFSPYLLARFCSHHPGVTVNLDVTNRDAVLKQLADNAPDMAIMGVPPEGANLVSQSFMPNPLVVIAAPNHMLAGMDDVPIKRVVKERFIIREPGSGTRDAFERFLNKSGSRLQNSMEMSSNEAIKHAVMAGLGLGVVSLHTLEMELKLGRLAIVDLVDFPLERQWYLVHRQGKRFSVAAQALKNFILTEAVHVVQATLPDRRVAAKPKRLIRRSIHSSE